MREERLTARSVKTYLQKAVAAAYGKDARPKPWQEDAIVKAAAAFETRQVFLFDHPRGSGKTREMAMMGFIALKLLKARFILVISDRTDLEEQVHSELKEFFSKAWLPRSAHGPPLML